MCFREHILSLSTYIYISRVYLSYIYFLSIYLMMWLMGAYAPRSMIDVLQNLIDLKISTYIFEG